MSYIPNSIAKLSIGQISRLLNGHGVRVKHGSHHQVELSSEQHKKLHRAHSKGAASTLTLDPFQISHHQHLRGGALNYDKFANNQNVKDISGALSDKAVEKIAGLGRKKRGGALNYDKFANNKNVKDISGALSDKAVEKIGGLGAKKRGGSVNRLNKAQRWSGFANDVYQGVAQAVKPVAQPIFQAGTQRAVSEINPTPQQQLQAYMTGYGRKRGGYLRGAESPY